MKAIGLDLGASSLGIALSDVTKTLARGIENYRFKQDDYISALNKVDELLKINPIDTIVLGYPKNMDGSIGSQATITEEFKTLLETRTNIPVILWDERLSTKMASMQQINRNTKKKNRKKTLDQEAAVVILQSYLDSKK